MAKGEFLWALGIVTALVGIAALVMAILRARRAADVRPKLRAVPPPRPSARRLARALPRPRAEVALEAAEDGLPLLAAVETLEAVEPEPDEADADEPATKICPSCGSRYAAAYRVCARCDNDLAALN
jgi:hypothetical protein